MEAPTQTPPQSGPPNPLDPATKAGPDAPEGVREAARGADQAKAISGEEEHGAVHFLLGQAKAARYEVPVQFDTEEGQKTLIFRIRALDGKTINKIEDANTDKSSPLGDIDDIQANADLVAEATDLIRDESGAETKPTDPNFLHGMVSAGDALRARFHYQSGLLAGLAGQVRRISGWAPDRIGEANRVLVEAAGNS